MTSEQMVRLAATALDSKKGQNIRAIGIAKVSVLTDYFVIAAGNSNTHVRALADEVEFALAQQGIRPYRIEGGDSESWMLMDYGGMIVHVFQLFSIIRFTSSLVSYPWKRKCILSILLLVCQCPQYQAL